VLYDLTYDNLNLLDPDEPIVRVGINTPGELEKHAGIWVSKAGARYFPSGFHYDSKTNIHWEWGAVLSGEFVFSYKGTLARVTPGMSYIMAPDITLTSKSIGNPLLVWVEITGALASEAAIKFGGSYGEVVLSHYNSNQVNNVLNIASLLHEHPYGYELLVHSNLWFFLANSILPKYNFSRKLSDEIQRTVDFIESRNVVENHTLPMLAAHSGLPLETFRKRFSAEIGESPIKYLLKYKIKKAKELLSDRNMNIQRIALATGFQDQYYFSRMFKKLEGLSPTEFRKRFFPELSDGSTR